MTTHDDSGGHSVNLAMIPRKYNQDHIIFGLEGSRKAGVSIVTFVTPQALFCARDKARKG